MNDQAAQEVVNAVVNNFGDSVAAKAAQAIIQTLEHPDPITILNDVKTAVDLIGEVHQKLSGMDKSVVNILKSIFG